MKTWWNADSADPFILFYFLTSRGQHLLNHLQMRMVFKRRSDDFFSSLDGITLKFMKKHLIKVLIRTDHFIFSVKDVEQKDESVQRICLENGFLPLNLFTLGHIRGRRGWNLRRAEDGRETVVFAAVLRAQVSMFISVFMNVTDRNRI